MIIIRIKIQRRGRVWKHIMGYIFAQYFFVFLIAKMRSVRKTAISIINYSSIIFLFG